MRPYLDKFRRHSITIVIVALVMTIVTALALFLPGLSIISQANDTPGTVNASATVSLPNYYLPGMVVQRNKPIIIKGSADAGTQLTISLKDDGNAVSSTTIAADDNGVFRASLPQLDGRSRPYQLTIASGGTVLYRIKQVYVGDVFVAAGQSNMELNYFDYYDKDGESAQENIDDDIIDNLPETIDDKLVRFIVTAHETTSSDKRDTSSSQGTTTPNPSNDADHESDISVDDLPLRDYQNGIWLPATSENSSYLGYLPQLFAQELRDKDSDIPVGIIQTAWGGTYIARHMKGGDIYDTHIAPLEGINIAGILWYQGENDAATDATAITYLQHFTTLIDDYRATFNDADLPFLYVQLSRYANHSDTPMIRQAQLDALRTVDNSDTVGMTVSIDTDKGTQSSIHPLGKDILAERMARQWFAIQENDSIPSGPLVDYATVHGSTVRIHFKEGTSDGLQAMQPIRETWAPSWNVAIPDEQADALTGFEIAGKDGKFHDATATITDDCITIQADSDDVRQIRYLWDPSPQDKTLLYNDDSLPASPFTITVE